MLAPFMTKLPEFVIVVLKFVKPPALNVVFPELVNVPVEIDPEFTVRFPEFVIPLPVVDSSCPALSVEPELTAV